MKKPKTTIRSNFDEKKERAEQRGDEIKFGAIARDLAQVPVEMRMLYIPQGVLQFNKLMDTNGCASRSPVAITKVKFTYFYHNGMHSKLKEWLRGPHYINGKPYSYVVGEGADAKVVFDETFIEILSGTTPEGNSLKAPVHAIHKYGLIPECLPLEDGMTWKQYMDRDRITEQHLDLGEEFMRRFTIMYEQVMREDFLAALQKDMLDVAGNAWPYPVNGVYKLIRKNFNHAFANITPTIHAFDSYKPFVKNLDPQSLFFDWGYSLSVTSQNPDPDTVNSVFNQLSALGLISAFIDWFRRFTNTADTPPDAQNDPVAPVLPPAVPESLAERIAQQAELALNTEPTPLDIIPDEVACVSSLVAVIRPEVLLDPDLAYTPHLVLALGADKRFERVTTPERGVIAVSPTVGSNVGHCAIFLDSERMASNNSFGGEKGLWTQNYTWQSWIAYFKIKKKLRIILFKPVG